MNERDPYRDPTKVDPNPPPQDPNLVQPGVEPYPADRRTVISQRTSSNGIWLLAAAIVLVGIAAFFLMGQPTGTSDVPATGTIPQTEQPAPGAWPVEPVAPEGPGGAGGAPALDTPPASAPPASAPPADAPPAGSPPAGGQPN